MFSIFHIQFIYGILPNYGSQNGLYGNVWQSVKGPQEARTEFPELMVGIGTFMEGIDENYIVYESFYISFHSVISFIHSITHSFIRSLNHLRVI